MKLRKTQLSQTVGYDGIIAIPQIPGVFVDADLPIQT